MSLEAIFGNPEPRPTPDEQAAQRVQVARTRTRWTEVPDDLVRRPPRYLVSASTGQAYRVYSGATFHAGTLEFAADQELAFAVHQGDVLVLEPCGEWSEIVAQRTGNAAGAR